MRYDKRYEVDKFQAICCQLSDAIVLFLNDGHATTVTSLVHASARLIKDLEKHFSDLGYFEPIKFWSLSVDEQYGASLFNYKKIDGKQGVYVSRGNFFKHADKDPQSAMFVSDNTAFEYLYATLQDFEQLKKELVDSGIVRTAEVHRRAAKKSGLYRELFDIFNGLTAPIRKISGSMFISKIRSSSPEPKIDFLSREFRSWYALLNHYINGKFPKIAQDFHDTALTDEMPIQHKFSMMNLVLSHVSMSAISLIFAKVGEKTGITDEGDYSRSEYTFLKTLRPELRSATTFYVSSRINKGLDRFSWHDSGYYIDLDGREADGAAFWMYDDDGLEFIHRL